MRSVAAKKKPAKRAAPRTKATTKPVARAPRTLLQIVNEAAMSARYEGVHPLASLASIVMQRMSIAIMVRDRATIERLAAVVDGTEAAVPVLLAELRRVFDAMVSVLDGSRDVTIGNMRSFDLPKERDARAVALANLLNHALSYDLSNCPTLLAKMPNAGDASRPSASKPIVQALQIALMRGDDAKPEIRCAALRAWLRALGAEQPITKHANVTNLVHKR